jgi:hypothetical protein
MHAIIVSASQHFHNWASCYGSSDLNRATERIALLQCSSPRASPRLPERNGHDRLGTERSTDGFGNTCAAKTAGRQPMPRCFYLAAASVLRDNGFVARVPDLGRRLYPGNLVAAHSLWELNELFEERIAPRNNLIEGHVRGALCQQPHRGDRWTACPLCSSRKLLLHRFLEGEHFLDAGTTLHALEVS